MHFYCEHIYRPTQVSKQNKYGYPTFRAIPVHVPSCFKGCWLLMFLPVVRCPDGRILGFIHISNRYPPNHDFVFFSELHEDRFLVLNKKNALEFPGAISIVPTRNGSAILLQKQWHPDRRSFSHTFFKIYLEGEGNMRVTLIREFEDPGSIHEWSLAGDKWILSRSDHIDTTASFSGLDIRNLETGSVNIIQTPRYLSEWYDSVSCHFRNYSISWNFIN